MYIRWHAGTDLGLAMVVGSVAIAGSAMAATPVGISSLPAVSSPVLIADDSTPYTVSMTASDKDGYNDIRAVAIIFNYSEAAGDQNKGRGYMKWGRTDDDVQQWGGAWTVADAGGGGRWGYRTDAWGGVTYITPTSCDTVVDGKASGGTGTRTVIFTFTVKSAWAHNPVMNDADAWIADGTIGAWGSYNIGWIDGQVPFDVVGAGCSTYCVTPSAPVVSNATEETIDVAVDPADSPDDQYAIMVSPGIGWRMYVQSDGTLGVAPEWQAKSNWGTTTITGLSWNTTYTLSVRASRSALGYCPSEWSPAAQITTTSAVPIINVRHGTPFSPQVRGQCPYRSVSAASWSPIWGLTAGSMGRGLAGGLDADTYDWRDIDSGSGWGTPTSSGRFTTLEFLQAARDTSAVPLITANAFGGGYRDWADPTHPGVFVCQNVNPDGLDADWVRYTNLIVQNYRQGQEGLLTGEDLRVYNSIANWGGKPLLLSPAEGAVPPVQYWEIGNEPELGGYGDFLSNHYLGPADYRDRYKLISEAMAAVDPALKFGPCLISPENPSSQWLPVLAADSASRIDFVGYHPYYGVIKNFWGFPNEMATTLRDCKAFLLGKASGIRSIMSQYGRSDYGLIASEWNPVNWDAPGIMQASMANALGVVESCFTFAEDGVLAATFWEQPQSKLGVAGAFTGLVNDMGDVLVASGTELGLGASDTNFRLYITKNQGDDSKLMIWGLNFEDERVVSVDLALAPCQVVSATLKHYGKPGPDSGGGDTSLTHSTGLAWDQQDISAGFDAPHFTFTMEDAEITVLVLDLMLVPQADFDRDRDVDQADFGYFQACLTGRSVPITDRACADANLDGDSDVDSTDLDIFLGCVSGPDIPADPYCAD